MKFGWAYWAALLGISISLAIPGRAQSQPDIPDSLFVHAFPDTLNLRVQWVYKGFDLRARHDQQPNSLLYRPRYRPRVGIGGFLWNIGFNLLLPLPLDRSTEDQRLRRFDFQGTLFARRWLLDMAFHRYRGFFVRSSDTKIGEGDEVFGEQLTTHKAQLSITYLPGGKRMSLRAPYNQGDRQQRASGSVLLSANGTYLSIRDPNNVIALPAAQVSDDPLSFVRVYAFSSKVGYTANLVYRGWFAHLFAMTGLDWQRTYYRQGNEQRSFSVEPNYDLRGGVGRDRGSWYAGIYGAIDYNQFQAGAWQFQGLSGQVRLFVGIRFAEPTWLRRRKPQFLKDLQNSPNIPLPPIFG